MYCILDAVWLSGITFEKQKLGRTFNFDKQEVIDFTQISNRTMCRASEARKDDSLKNAFICEMSVKHV